ncbi:sodium/potassium-transporting ATPase subunit beta-2-like [Athalia rosae]|uniref:sodium/potassium-transporting ATPase subunit beta-2-like n=1 Tax=Athalia rosae TaxID=37344 RepID=UPI0020342893|nr:sodium/potassium-transporting ATPase subunit beta-2-like [Athalia rosae]
MLILHDEAYYERRKPQPDLGAVDNFKRFVWNPNKRSFLDKTLEGWAQTGLFYMVFFGIIFSLFALKLWITLKYIYSMDKPYIFIPRNVDTTFENGRRMMFFTRSGDEGPGLSFKPNILTPMTSPIIWISQRDNNAQPRKYIEALNEFLEGYTEENLQYTSQCEDGIVSTANARRPCFFNISALGPCGKPPYGYLNREPCVLIAFNKMFHWEPVYYNPTSDLPLGMPAWLKKLVRKSTKASIWISCAGANQMDKEHMGEILYLPSPRFPVEYFPYYGDKHHMPPLVALKFKNVAVNRLITVECTAWAQNIHAKNGYSLDFQIMIGE